MRISFFSGLLLLFIGLKLGGAINWSWYWVLSPITLPLSVAAFAFLVAGIMESFNNAKKY